MGSSGGIATASFKITVFAGAVVAGAAVVGAAVAGLVVVFVVHEMAVPIIRDRITRKLKKTNPFFNFLSSFYQLFIPMAADRAHNGLKLKFFG
jgi:hypothetical protein